jgi:hypothetical protein
VLIVTSPKPLFLIDGRCVHKTSNALKITFADGPDDTPPLGIGEQGVNDGKSKKFATLLGFKNGGVGNHRLTMRDGSVINVASLDSKPSEFTRGDGSALATAVRGASTDVNAPDGTLLLTVTSDPVEAKSPDLFRLQVADGRGAPVAEIDVIRRATGWSLAQKLLDIDMAFYWWDHAGQSLPIPILGARIAGYRAVSDLERDLLMAICVDITIGLRPYIAEMN